jgi:hypothetical protein
MATLQLPSTEAILMGGLPTSTIVCGTHAGVSNNGGEREATPAAAVAAAAAVGRGSTVRRMDAEAIRMKGGWQRGQQRQGTRSNYINIRNYIYAYFSCNSCHAMEAIQQHANPCNIDMIFMNWMCYSVGRWPKWTRKHAPPCKACS